AGFSDVWGGKPISRVRGGDGTFLLHGRRLSIHLMAQPSVANFLLSSDALKDQGLLSRFLIAHPQSAAGTRFYKKINPHNNPRLKAYFERIQNIMSKPLSMDETNALNPKIFKLTDQAYDIYVRFHDDIEKQTTGVLSTIYESACKAAEQAARIAGVLAMINNPDASEIDEAAMSGGVCLMAFYLNEDLRLIQAGDVDKKYKEAKRLGEWLRGLGRDKISLVEIYQDGPNSLRTARKAREVMKVLEDHGWVYSIDGIEYKGKHRKEAWGIVKL
ncbi:MAG: DUF3987 domain-containing protein, partial [Candidatus Hinthialibacter sp.]